MSSALLFLLFFAVINGTPLLQEQQRWLYQTPPKTPCPAVFRYEQHTEQWVGAIAAVPPEISFVGRNQTLVMKIVLHITALIQPNQFVGRVDLKEDNAIVADRLRSGDTRTPIQYRVWFPVQSPLPQVISIEMNSNTLCKQQKSDGETYSTITLSHTLNIYSSIVQLTIPSRFPSNINKPPIKPATTKYPTTTIKWTTVTTRSPSIQQTTLIPSIQQTTRSPSIQQTTRIPSIQQTTRRPSIQQTTQIPSIQTTARHPAIPWYSTTQTPTTAPPHELQLGVHFFKKDDECGRPVHATNLVFNGMDSKRDEWPWLVAIFTKTKNGLSFHCGGSLVSLTRVVTAAHCIQHDGRRYPPETLVVYLGKYNLSRWTEHNNQPRDVLRTIIHPNYQSEGEKIGVVGVDLAVLVLSIPAVPSISVQPVCLWDETLQKEHMDTSQGTVVGWGRDEKGNQITDIPRQTVMPVVSQEVCLRSHHHFLLITSETSFCAGSRDGSGPCTGDSGGGMYIKKHMPDGTTRWIVRGVVSLSLKKENTVECDLTNFVVFADTIKHVAWIRTNI